jgi:hypothetical protein
MAAGFGAVGKMVRRALCALVGHDTLLHFDEHRLWLRCVTCGYETTGWTIGDVPSRADLTTSPSLAPIETRHAA